MRDHYTLLSPSPEDTPLLPSGEERGLGMRGEEGKRTSRLPILFASLFTLSLLFPFPAVTADDTVKLRGFADSLFAEGEYFRASTEYLRLLSYQPGIPDADQVRFRVAQCSYRAGRFEEASARFGALAAAASSTMMVDQCRLMVSACHFRREDWYSARDASARAAVLSPASPLRDRFHYLNGLACTRLGMWDASFNAFARVPAESPLAESARELGGLSARAQKIPPASPPLAACLSLVVPGLGQALNGYAWDGVTAFLMSAGSLALALYGTDNGNRGMEAAGYTLFVVWHSANIYGGANSARRANRRMQERLVGEAGRISQLSLD